MLSDSLVPRNTVIRLSGETNAHGEGPDETTPGYFDVCYGKLDCQLSSGSCDETQGFRELVALNSSSNSHIEKADRDTGFYNTLICCRIAGEFLQPEWQDFTGEGITESFLGNTVQMVAETTFPDASGAGKFEVWEADNNPDDPIRTGADAIEGFILNGKAIGWWTITEDDLAKTDDYEEFYFNLSLQGVKNQSGFLLVNTELDPNNQYPKAIISKPMHKQIYFVNTPIKFSEKSTDVEGPLDEFLWTLERNGNVINNSDKSDFTNTFTELGEVVITLRVTDSGRLISEDQIAILVVDSPGLFAFINSPFHQEIVHDDDNTHLLHFNASDSYVILSEGNSCNKTITCLSGSCPAYTEGIPLGCQNNFTLQGPLNQGYDALHFNWAFDDGEVFSGNGGVSGARFYGDRSNNINDKEITLTVTYSDESLSPPIMTGISKRAFTLGQCTNNGGTVLIDDDNDGVFEIKRSTFEQTNVCTIDGNAGDNNDCCPSSFQCTENGCIGTQFLKCADYTDDFSCNNDIANVVAIDPLWTQFNCGQTIDGVTYQCQCAWNESSSGNPCGLVVEALDDGGFNSTDLCTLYTCLNTYTASACDKGLIRVNVKAQLNVIDGSFEDCIGNPIVEQCVDNNYTLLCQSFITEVSFFNIYSLIISILIVMVIYSFILYYKKKE